MVIANIKNFENIQEGYINFLNSLEWQYWCTGTTYYELTLASARRLIERYSDILYRQSIPNRIFWVAEAFELRFGYHLHFLLYIYSTSISIKNLYDFWQYAIRGKKNNVMSRITIKKYIKKIGAGGYCSKYILKKKTDYDLIITKDDKLML